MKKYILSLVFITAFLFKGWAQSAVPAIDGKQYEQMKQDRAFPKDAVISKPLQPYIPTADTKRLNASHTSGPVRMPATSCSTFIPGGIPALGPCDDLSTGVINLPFTFCFYGTNYTSCYINNNGNISFGSPYGTFSSTPFPSTSYVMIAPFWADVDTRGPTFTGGGGTVLYTLTPTYLIVTWDSVGYFSGMVDKLNSFQVIITDGVDPILPGGNNVAFNYGDMQWTTGSASGGTGGFGGTTSGASPATVGVNKGDGINYIQMGRFAQPGGAYDGGYGLDDGIDWLDHKSFYFNVCGSSNIPPIPSGVNNCDTVKLCGLGDTLLLNELFLSPEPGQTTTVGISLGGMSGATVVSNVPGNSAATTIQIIASAANAGYHTITYTATDDGTPAGVTVINALIFVDTAAAAAFHPTLSGNLSFCEGDSSLISVTPTTYDSYLWSTGATTPSTYINAAGSYSVTSKWNGCSQTNFFTANVHPKPTPVIVGTPLTPCSTTVTLTVDSLIYSTYSWSNGSTGTSITVGTGNYTVTVTDANGCTATSPIHSVVTPIPPDITALADTSFCGGGTANLNVIFNGGGVPATCGLSPSGGCGGAALMGTVGTGLASNTTTSYPAPYGNFYTTVKQQYLYTAAELNAAGITGGKIDQLDFNVTQIDGIALYHNFNVSMGCTGLTTFSSTPTAFESGLVNVFSAPTFSISTGWNAHVFTNAFQWDGTSNIIVEVCFNELNPGASWSSNSLTAYTNTSYISTIATLSDADDQCTTPDGFWETANAHPDIRFHYCSIAANPANFTYLWTPSSGVIASPTSQATTAQPPASMDYYVLVTDITSGCTDQDTVHVDVYNINTLTVTPAGPFCVNGSIDTLHVSIPLGMGLWTGTGITNDSIGIFNPATAGVGTFPVIYAVNGACGTGADTINITVIPQPDATITAVGNQCLSGASITLTAATTGGIWSGTGITDSINGTFDPSIAGIGNHIITYHLTTPCTAVDTVIVPVVSQLDPTITNAGPFCTANPAVTLTAVDAGGTWSGTGITNASTGTFDPATAGPGSHIITYTISGLCGAVDTSTIVVIPSPVISFTADTTEGCEPTTITFTGITDQPGGTCSWNFGDGNTSTNCNPSNSYQLANSYSVTFTYSNTIGCTSSITQTNLITIHSQPHAVYSASPQPTSIVNPTVHFTDESIGVITNWNWSFGTGDTSLIQDPTYTYADTGSFPTHLIVYNNFGCADTAYETIRIDQILVFYAPNAFTPDGNGINDVFMVKGDGIDLNTFEMRIFDRWGELIFKSNDLYKGWNGAMFNVGDILQQDVYVWKVDFKDYTGLRHSYIGHVTLTK